MYDLIIIGGGPAGSTLARFLSDRYKILLLEKRSFNPQAERRIIKSCGGLVAPDAQKMLAHFDLGIPKNILVSPQIFYVRSVDLDTGREQCYQRHYLNIDREKFDSWLLSLAEDRTEIRTGAEYIDHEKTADGVLVRAQINGISHEFETRILIGADGASSRVRRKQTGFSRPGRIYTAFQAEFRRVDEVNHFGAFFSRDITDFYCWLIPKDDIILIGGAFRGGGSKGKFDLLVEKLENSGYVFGTKLRSHGCRLIRPLRSREINTVSGNTALIGEAAGFISPSSAEGFSYAFSSAAALSEALRSGTNGWQKRYNANCKALRTNIFLKNCKSIVMYNGFLRNMVFRTGIGHVNRLIPESPETAR